MIDPALHVVENKTSYIEDRIAAAIPTGHLLVWFSCTKSYCKVRVANGFGRTHTFRVVQLSDG